MNSRPRRCTDPGGHMFPEGSEQRAIEYVSLLSFLAYRVQEAKRPQAFLLTPASSHSNSSPTHLKCQQSKSSCLLDNPSLTSSLPRAIWPVLASFGQASPKFYRPRQGSPEI